MLEHACLVAAETGIYVSWRQHDMREFAVAEPVELVTCFYDAINYLTEVDDLDAMAARVWDALVPGGYLVFDLNPGKSSKPAGTAAVSATNREDIFGVYQSWYEEETGLSPLILTFFVRKDDGSWERFDEEHLERL